MSEEIVQPQPRYLPGYTGYYPQKKDRIGANFSYHSNEVLTDPEINLSENLVLSDLVAGDYQFVKPVNIPRDLCAPRIKIDPCQEFKKATLKKPKDYTSRFVLEETKPVSPCNKIKVVAPPCRPPPPDYPWWCREKCKNEEDDIVTIRPKPNTIYYRQIGLVPYYMGHAPGANFRIGRTFGKDTIDTKRWFRGIFT